MIYLIWSILNIFLHLYFIYLVFGFITRGKQIFKSRFKIVSIFILIVGLIQIATALNSDKKVNTIKINDVSISPNNSKQEEFVLENNFTFDINMHVKYVKNHGAYIPVESNSFLTGLVSGYVWEFKSVQLNKNKESIAKGILKWNLFGITIYSQLKTFKEVL